MLDLLKYSTNAGWRADERLLANTMVIHKKFSAACVDARLPAIMSVSFGERGKLGQVFVHALTEVKLLEEQYVIIEVIC